jgi:hypothetical protein
MIITKPKKLLFWILFGIVAYQLFNYVKMQTYDDVVVYKRLAKSIMKNDDYIIGQISDPKVTENILNSQAERNALFYGSNIVLTYYTIKSRSLSAEGDHVYLKVEQVSRVNPPYTNTVWGKNEVRLEHDVRLTKKGDRWVVSYFEDPVLKH